ncbi:MAG: NfeD family protein [Thiotrichales bacterium]|nr:NfeD family protein [Thiotrichales bacterium]
MAILDGILFWHWFIAAVILIAVEMMIPAAYMLWMGVAAIVVGILMYFIPGMPWLVQVIIFAVVSVVSVIMYKNYMKKNKPATDTPNLNRRSEQYVGRTFTLAEPIVNGVGKVRIGDSMWKVRGDDMEAGKNVKVVDADGVILHVEAE